MASSRESLCEGFSHCFDNSVVGAAATKIAAHALANFFVAEVDVVRCYIFGYGARHTALDLIGHADGRTNLPWRAVSALEAVMLDKGALQRMHFARSSNAFYRRDRPAL